LWLVVDGVEVDSFDEREDGQQQGSEDPEELPVVLLLDDMPSLARRPSQHHLFI
jgi:hypothetical protein